MYTNTIDNQSKKIKEVAEKLLVQYKDIQAKVIEIYNIIVTTDHPYSSEIKEFIDNMDNKIKDISVEYANFSESIQKYIKTSDSNYEKLEKDIYTISRDLMDVIETLK